MTRARRFSRAEIMDAARAAAETGLSARLSPSGEIEFFHQPPKRDSVPASPEALLEGWLSEAGGRA